MILSIYIFWLLPFKKISQKQNSENLSGPFSARDEKWEWWSTIYLGPQVGRYHHDHRRLWWRRSQNGEILFLQNKEKKSEIIFLAVQDSSIGDLVTESVSKTFDFSDTSRH